MKKIVLLTFFFSSIASAQINEDEQIFNFSDESNNSQEITIGKNPYATDGIDSTLGEELIPQVPSGQFGVRFQLPPDTSITTVKDIRFGCYWATGFYHLVDIRKISDSSIITVEWIWGSAEEGELSSVYFNDPYTGQTIAWYPWSQGGEIFNIPIHLDKITMNVGYSGSLSSAWYDIISPNGGEIIQGGSIYAINYDGFYYGGPAVDIEYSSDSGATWNLIIENYWSNNETYEWNVPLINSENCLIRLGDYPCAYDLSDSIFTITFPVKIENENELPTEFSLSQNYPNPFNPTTSIQYAIGSRQFVSLKVYDVLGNEVATLVNEEKPAGEYEVEFTVGQDSSPDIASGIYFYQLQAGSLVETKKMILLK